MSLARDLSSEIHDQLVARNDVLFGLVLTDQGVAATKIVSSPEMVAVFGVAADEQGTAVKAGVATADGTEVVDGYVPVDDGSAPAGRQ